VGRQLHSTPFRPHWTGLKGFVSRGRLHAQPDGVLVPRPTYADAVDPPELRRSENDAVLAYLEVEQLPEWRESKSPWVVEGYALTTHPDLCDRVQEVNAAVDGKATFRFLYGKPVLIAENGVIVAFANGTHTFCVRLALADCDPELIDAHRYPPSRFPIVQQKQRRLAALAAEDWTRLDPYTVNVPKAEGLARLGAHLERAIAATLEHHANVRLRAAA